MISTLVLHKAYGPDAIKSSASSVQPSNALVCARKKRRKGGHASLVTRHLFPSSISRQGEIDNQESGSAHFPVMYPVTISMYRLDDQDCIKFGVGGPLFIYKMVDNNCPENSISLFWAGLVDHFL